MTLRRKLRGFSTLTCSPSMVTSMPPPAPPPPASQREVILGVERKCVVDQHAAARAKRQPLDVTVLREPGRRANT